MTMDPRFTRWRALFLAEKRNISLQTSLSAGLSVQYLQPATASFRSSDGVGKTIGLAGGSNPRLVSIEGSAEALANADGSGAAVAPVSGSGATLNP